MKLVMDVALQDVDVSCDVNQETTLEKNADVTVTRVEFRGVDITHLLKRKEISSIELDIEHNMDLSWKPENSK